MAFANAVTAAINHEVDILNVSAGRSRPTCTHGGCVYCTEVRRATENGITVVGAAGNHPDDAVHCPGNAPPGVSVGGVEMECTFNMPRIPHNPTNNPPLAYWTRLRSSPNEYPETATDEVYCSTRGCWSERGGCDQYMQRTAWDRNPIPSGEKPDVLAPLHYAEENETGYPFVWAASSFAAPIVSGCLSGILSTCEMGKSPVAIREAIREASLQLDSAPAGVFDAKATLKRLN